MERRERGEEGYIERETETDRQRDRQRERQTEREKVINIF